MENAPLVAVTGPRRRLKLGWWVTRRILGRCGARAIYLSRHAAGFPENIQAVVIGGGDDINPGLYGGIVEPEARFDADRDLLELDVLSHALEHNLPILGICRGAQLLNVKLGGSLHQDIRPMRRLTRNRNSLVPNKRVLIQPDSRLGGIIGKPSVRVNSLHHQAVDQPGDGLRVVAHDRDQLVQAVENRDQPFQIGVQWHPEYLWWKPEQVRIFKALVDSARVRSDS